MQGFFQSLADRLMQGDLTGVVEHYTFPLVVYEPAGIEIHKTVEHATIRLAERLMSLRSGGAMSVVAKLENTGPILRKRQPFDITKTYLDVHGHPIGESRLRYFCREDQGRIRIELIEIFEGFRMNAFQRASAVNH